MTQKANSQRKYQVFVKMLLAALDKSSEVVFVDFITFQDLEIFKAKRNNDPDKMLKAQSINSQKNSRRYLIMTFSNDMEQVHYPLVLSQVNSNDTGELKEVLNRLSVAYEEAKSFDSEARLSSYSNTTNEFFRKGMAEYNPLIEENEQLKKTIAELKGEAPAEEAPAAEAPAPEPEAAAEEPAPEPEAAPVEEAPAPEPPAETTAEENPVADDAATEAAAEENPDVPANEGEQKSAAELLSEFEKMLG